MDFAMDVTNGMLSEALTWMDRNPAIIVVFATSMGQAAVHRDGYEGYSPSVCGIATLMAVCGLQAGEFTALLAMVPQIAVRISNPLTRASAAAVLRRCLPRSGAILFEAEQIAESLSITVGAPGKSDVAAGGFSVSGEDGTERWVAWDAAGIQINEVEPGTAYHIPEGVLTVCDARKSASDTRTTVKASDVKSMLMSWSGLQSAA